MASEFSMTCNGVFVDRHSESQRDASKHVTGPTRSPRDLHVRCVEMPSYGLVARLKSDHKEERLSSFNRADYGRLTADGRKKQNTYIIQI